MFSSSDNSNGRLSSSLLSLDDLLSVEDVRLYSPICIGRSVSFRSIAIGKKSKSVLKFSRDCVPRKATTNLRFRPRARASARASEATSTVVSVSESWKNASCSSPTPPQYTVHEQRKQSEAGCGYCRVNAARIRSSVERASALLVGSNRGPVALYGRAWSHVKCMCPILSPHLN